MLSKYYISQFFYAYYGKMVIKNIAFFYLRKGRN